MTSAGRSFVWPMTRDVARRLGVAAALVFALTGGGRIVGSDELAMFELSRAMLKGSIAVPEGATLQGPDGRHYTKNAAAQAVLALPLVAIAEGAAGLARLDPARHALAVRLKTSFFNGIVVAILLAAFYTIARRLGVRPWRAFGASVLLGFTTPLWVYAKSFMAEPLQALGLLLALGGCAGLGDRSPRRAPLAGAPPRREPHPGSRMAAVGVFLAVSVKLSMLPLALACMAVLAGRPAAAWRAPIAGLSLALFGHAAYNAARFGTPFESGYGMQATAAAYTTPLWVGLYGLLLSTGKGVLWFAPALWIALPRWLAGALPFAELPPSRDPEVAVARGWMRAAAALTPEQRVRWGAAFACVAALLLYGRFQHWAGDGSFGPRYLIPVLPLAFLVVALELERGSRTVRRWAWTLGLVGCLVQIGGVAVYFGAQMREAGDYPYALPLEHPRFMSESHFNPRYAPIAGHWRMLARNVGEHLSGDAPRLKGVRADGAPAGPEDPSSLRTPPPEPALGIAASSPDATASGDGRIAVGAEDQARLLHALDFWWTYLAYAGFPRAPLAIAVMILVLMSVWAVRRAAFAARREAVRT